MPEKNKTEKSKWVYALRESNNKEMKYKLRYPASGFNQIKNKNITEWYSPVVNI